ncbi:MAG TPA: twin-arginine translocase TatA/TatE family subunit [Candidatus Eremiobacteraceae bacterium]|nr:twin-arginine translocase TatA/TatE family subunit [Candidatus Eremiobacteraceae bacterium]
MLSPSDTAIVFVLALLLFGPEQLPKLARQLGEAMRHIQNTTHSFMMEMERAADTPESHVNEPALPDAPQVSDEVPATIDETDDPLAPTTVVRPD